jgi:hypothetical protein
MAPMRYSTNLEMRLSDWHELFSYLLKFPSEEGWIFRGQKEHKWRLVTSLERVLPAEGGSPAGVERVFTDGLLSVLRRS